MVAEVGEGTNEPKKYWAFISYSSKDRKWGKWLHSRLENYPIPKEFQGTKLFDGATLGKDLKPCFRDRDELSGSAELGPAITKALNDTRYLIVLCSPNSAKSEWVNKEIEDFKEIGGEERILALILDGEPNSGDDMECFPPVLRYPTEPLAGDMRKEGDGKERGFLKILSGIAQLDFDVLYRRHERAKRRRVLMLGALALSLITLFAGIAIFALAQKNLAEKNEASADEARTLAEEATTQVEMERDEQKRLLKSASRNHQETGIRAFENGDRIHGFANLAQALTLWPENYSALQKGVNEMAGPAAPPFILREADLVDRTEGWSVFSEYGGRIARIRHSYYEVVEIESGKIVTYGLLDELVKDAELSSDGTLLVAALYDGQYLAINLSRKEVVFSGRFKKTAERLNLSRDGRMLVVGSWDHSCQVVDLTKRQVVSETRLPGVISDVGFSPDTSKFIAACRDGKGYLIETATGEVIRSFTLEESAEECAYSRDGSLFAIGDVANHVLLANQFGEVKKRIEIGGSSGLLKFSPDSFWLGIIEPHESVQLVPLHPEQPSDRLEMTDVVNDFSFSPDASMLAICDRAGVVKIYRRQKLGFSEVQEERFHESVESVEFTGDGRWLMVSLAEGGVRVYEKNPSSHQSLHIIPNRVTHSIITDDGGTIIVAGTNTDLASFNAKNGGLKKHPNLMWEETSSLALSPNEKYLMIAGGSQAGMHGVMVIERSSQKVIYRLESPSYITAAAFDPTGEYLVTGSRKDGIMVYRTATGELISSTPLEFEVLHLEFRPGIQELVVLGESPRNQPLFVFDFISGKILRKFSLKTSGGDHLAVTGDGSSAVVEGSGNIKFIDLDRGTINLEIASQENVTEILISPNKKYLAVAGNVQTGLHESAPTLQIHDLKTGEKISSSTLPSLGIALDFSPNGHWILVSGMGDSVNLIESKTGKHLLELPVFGATCQTLGFSRKGDAIYYATDQGLCMIVDSRWFDQNSRSSAAWRDSFETNSGMVFNQVGQLLQVENDSMTRRENISDADAKDQIFNWLYLHPDDRTVTPWSAELLRDAVERNLIGAKVHLDVTRAADAAPWHPLVPISLARIANRPERVPFLAKLSLEWIKRADPEKFSQEILKRYREQTLKWALELGLEEADLK